MKTITTPRRLRGAVRGLSAAMLCLAALAAPAHAAGTGTMDLRLVDSFDTPLPGACFELYNVVDGEVTSQADSFCNFSGSSVRGLPQGRYLITETQPPTGTVHLYRKSPDQEFSIVTNSTTTVRMEHVIGAAVDVSAVLPDGTTGATHSCFTAVLRNTGAIVDAACSNDAASARLYVPAHSLLSIYQVSGPSGYGLALKGLVDDPLADHVYPVTLQMREPAGLIIQQQDEDGTSISGGCYSLQIDGSSAASACDANDPEGRDGRVHFTGLNPDTYQLVETEAPDGYQLIDGSDSISLGTGSTPTIVRHHQALPTLTVTTTSAAGTALPGSCWRVYTPDEHEGWVGEACDGDDGSDDGTTHLGAFQAGSYELLHMIAPDGYERIDDFLPFEQGADDQTLTYVLGRERAPEAVTAPSIAGQARVGSTLTGDKGTWQGTPDIDLFAHWQRCDASGNACVDLPATDDTYALTADDAGATFRFAVQARNPVDTVEAVSEPTAVVTDGAVDPLAPRLADGSAPSATGALRVGSKLSGKQGTWQGARPLAYAFQWQRCGQSGQSCEDIAGGSARTYVLQQADVGFAVRLVVTATNGHGSATAATAARYLAPNAPLADPAKAPQVKGTLKVGSLLTATQGKWKGGKPTGYAFHWERCNAAATACTGIPGADQQTYAPTADDAGSFLRVLVTASNADGSGLAVSTARGAVRS